MRAAPMKTRPSFSLMKQEDIQNFYHLQMPRWLFSDPNYNQLCLEAKVVYTFLLNRFQLSRLNGWINDSGEVFIIYTRDSLANEIQVGYKRVITAMKELTAAKLIWEKRCGRGDANQIYLAKMEHTREAVSSAPFVDAGDEAAGPRKADLESLACEEYEESAEFQPHCARGRSSDSAPQEMPEQHIKSARTGPSGDAGLAHPDRSNQTASNTEKNYIDLSDTQSSQSQNAPVVDDSDGTDALESILEQCNLEIFPPETAKVFEHAIERLFYSQQLQVGTAVLPQSRIRARLWELNATHLQTAARKLRQVLERPVKNSTAYIMAVVFNSITEAEGDLLVDPYLNAL